MISFPGYVKSMAGRWQPRPRTVPAVPVDAYGIDWTGEPADAPHSTLREACLLLPGEQVLVVSRWMTVARVERLPCGEGASLIVLHMVDGVILSSRFDHVYTSRDEDEVALAAKEAVR